MIESSTFTILLVDDNQNNLDLLKCYLQSQQYNICAVTCGEKALKVLNKVSIDLILLDIIMPGMDGYQVCKKLKNSPRFSHIPIVFVTAKTEPEELRKGLSIGAIDYITKPINQDIVIARVNSQLAQVKQSRLERNLMKKEHKMAELGKLVTDITHEVASPLSTMMLSVDHIQEQTLVIQKAFEGECLDKATFANYMMQLTEALMLCKRNSERASEILTSFKQVAVDQCSLRVVEFDLLKYIKDIILTLKPKFRNLTHTISIDIEQGLIINSYPGVLSQVITNLINNSLIHAFKGNKFGEIKIVASLTNNQVCLRYSDNGIGMTENQQQQAFNKFYTTKAGEGGSGLGLAICKELVENTLRGSIIIESILNTGTTFLIKLEKDILFNKVS